MKIIITSGPSYEPLDAVRRLTNLSTGELGTLLANALAAAGHEVICYRSTSSTYAPPSELVATIPFQTNDELEDKLYQMKHRESVQAVFHVAALCDFRIREVKDEQGNLLSRDKVSSRNGLLQLTLEPVTKLLPSLRTLFPASLIIGWKYEGQGDLARVLKRGREQIEDNLTDLCVVNGPGYGKGFGVLCRSGEKAHLDSKQELSEFLTDWLNQTPTACRNQAQESFHALASLLPLAPFL